ncbi:right-handed parallel beta-helix repeat-containing protein [Klebsiella quasipneumoniae]|uniref:right-handed parallel beta-helix repeat-containing protein n=1 Tax=Klebsiella quasipneumoniae TaxID=1463165 RepID=UPI003B9EB464
MAELIPPLGTTTPEIFLDNVKRADRLVNGPEATILDRGGEPLDSWRLLQKKITLLGGLLGFASESELLAFTPGSGNQVGMDTATGTLWLWNGSAWSKAGYQNSDIIDYMNDLVGSTTLATIGDLTGSNYIAKADGSRVPSTNWRNSTFLSVKEGQKLILTATSNGADFANIAFYDVNQVFISADNAGVGSSVYQRVFTVPADGFIILATRVTTSSTFSCDILKDVMTIDNKDRSGGYTSYEEFEKTITSLAGDPVSAGGVEAFPVPGFVSVALPTSYPTVSETSFNTGFVKVAAGGVITAKLAMAATGYGIAFFANESAASFVEGVIGTDATKIQEYRYTAPADGYVVMSLTTGALPSAAADSSYSITSSLVKRREIDSALDTAIPSTQNLVENKAADVYYEDVDAKSSAVVTQGNYIGVNGALVQSASHKLFAVGLAAGESIYAKVNLNTQTTTVYRGIPVLSKLVSPGIFAPLTFAFVAGAAYTEHLYTAAEACTIYVTAYATETLPAVIRKRKYAIGNKVKQYSYAPAVWETGIVHSNTNFGRVDPNLSFMSTPLIPVKKGDVVKAKTAQNSTSVGASLNMGCRYDVVGKYLGGTLTFTYTANNVYAYAVTRVEDDGFIAANHYLDGGLNEPEVMVFSPHENENYSVKGPASNPYGDIYPGYGYDDTGTMIRVAGSVTYLFDRAAVPKDATVTLSFRSAASVPLVKLDADRNVLSAVLFSAGIKTLTLLDLFDTDDVEFVGITHSSDGRRDSTSVSLQVDGRGSSHNFFQLSEPVYELYELAGRPDKTLAYDYTALLQKLCLQMERQKRGKVHMESGLYKVSSCYIKSFNHIYGDGMYNTIISGADIPFKNEKLSDHVYEKVTITDLGFNLDLLGTRAGRGINMEYVKDLVIRNIWIYKSGITGFGVDMIMSGVLDNIVTEGCGQGQQDGSCAGMGIGVGAFLAGQEPIQVINCINRNNYGHGMFFEWHNHRESSGETVIGDFPVGINVVNCYSEGNAVGFGNAGGNGVSFVNCTAFRNLNGFAADNGSQVAGIRYGKNALFSGCKAIENGSGLIQNPYFTPRQMRYGNGNGFAVYKTADYTDAAIGDNARGYYFDNCISEDNETHALRIVAATNVTTPIREISVNGGSYSRNGGSGIQFGNAAENVIIRGVMALNNGQNGIGVSAWLTDAIIKDNIIKGNAKGMSATGADFMSSSIVRDNIVKGNGLNLENIINQ